MALAVGNTKKWHIYAVAGVICVMVAALLWELGVFDSAPAARPTAQVTAQAARPAAAAPHTAQRVDLNSLDPTLHLAKLAQAEDVVYHGSGRNIFSAESVPVIPKPIAPIRQVSSPVQAGPVIPPTPQAPPIDLKYFGYLQTPDKSMEAFLSHGDAVFLAHEGDVVDRRYRVTGIKATSLQVTDLSYNNTQTIARTVN